MFSSLCQTLMEDGKRESAVSMLPIVPEDRDSGRTYTCRVVNPAAPAGRQTSVSINVQREYGPGGPPGRGGGRGCSSGSGGGLSSGEPPGGAVPPAGGPVRSASSPQRPRFSAAPDVKLVGREDTAHRAVTPSASIC